MRPYAAVLSARFRVLLQYRAAALAGLGTQLFWGAIRVMILTAFYRSTTGDMPMSLQETVNYVWLGQALLLLIPWRIDPDVQQLIRSGNVANELVRPVDLYWLWFWRAVAMRTAPVMLRALPLWTVALLFFGLEAPASAASLAAFGLSALAGVALSSAVTMILTITIFWTLSGDWIRPLANAVTTLLAGLIVPLPLFPDSVQTLLTVLPFRGLMDVPVRIYMGHIPPGEALLHIAGQAAWVVVLVIAGRLLLRRASRAVVVQGG